MSYAPFHYYVNGGRALIEGRGEFELEPMLVGDDAVELDQYVIRAYGLDTPAYLMEPGVREARPPGWPGSAPLLVGEAEDV